MAPVLEIVWPTWADYLDSDELCRVTFTVRKAWSTCTSILHYYRHMRNDTRCRHAAEMDRLVGGRIGWCTCASQHPPMVSTCPTLSRNSWKHIVLAPATRALGRVVYACPVRSHRNTHTLVVFTHGYVGVVQTFTCGTWMWYVQPHTLYFGTRIGYVLQCIPAPDLGFVLVHGQTGLVIIGNTIAPTWRALLRLPRAGVRQYAYCQVRRVVYIVHASGDVMVYGMRQVATGGGAQPGYFLAPVPPPTEYRHALVPKTAAAVAPLGTDDGALVVIMYEQRSHLVLALPYHTDTLNTHTMSIQSTTAVTLGAGRVCQALRPGTRFGTVIATVLDTTKDQPRWALFTIERHNIVDGPLMATQIHQWTEFHDLQPSNWRPYACTRVPSVCMYNGASKPVLATGGLWTGGGCHIIQAHRGYAHVIPTTTATARPAEWV